jgi:hypothetical protein
MAMMPCTDVYCGGDHGEIEQHEHNHDESESDGCSPLCFCACCGTSFTIPTLELKKQASHFTMPYSATIFNYTNNYSFSFSSSVWHPPSLI